MTTERPDGSVEDVAGLGFDPDALREKYRIERDKRMRPDGIAQYQELTGEFAKVLDDPHVDEIIAREYQTFESAPFLFRMHQTERPLLERYVPAKNEGRKVVADLGDRHATEILVADVDGEGDLDVDELTLLWVPFAVDRDGIAEPLV